jgi:hypothetical protein
LPAVFGAVLAARGAEGLLHGVTPFDPAAISGAVLAMAVVAAAISRRHARHFARRSGPRNFPGRLTSRQALS